MKKIIAAALALTALSPLNAGAYNYTVQQDDSFWTISQETGTDFWQLMAHNGANENTVICPGDVIDIPDDTSSAVSTNVASGDYYVVQSGEGWYSVAEHMGLDVQTVLNLKGATLGTMLYAGDKIYYSGYQEATYTQQAYNPVGTLLGSKTLYNYPSGNSWYNICHAADMLNGVVVYPYETFSMWWCFPNQAGYADGFLDSGAFGANGELIQSPGGGICFVSTTFFQCAVYECGLVPIERHDHVNPVSYAVQGTDAAVNFFPDKASSQDMQFYNNTNNTLKFTFAYDYSGALTVSCYIIG